MGQRPVSAHVPTCIGFARADPADARMVSGHRCSWRTFSTRHFLETAAAPGSAPAPRYSCRVPCSGEFRCGTDLCPIRTTIGHRLAEAKRADSVSAPASAAGPFAGPLASNSRAALYAGSRAPLASQVLHLDGALAGP